MIYSVNNLELRNKIRAFVEQGDVEIAKHVRHKALCEMTEEEIRVRPKERTCAFYNKEAAYYIREIFELFLREVAKQEPTEYKEAEARVKKALSGMETLFGKCLFSNQLDFFILLKSAVVDADENEDDDEEEDEEDEALPDYGTIRVSLLLNEFATWCRPGN